MCFRETSLSSRTCTSSLPQILEEKMFLLKEVGFQETTILSLLSSLLWWRDCQRRLSKLKLPKRLWTKYIIRGGSRGRVQGVRILSWDYQRFSNTISILLKKKKKSMWFIGVEVEQETIAPPPKKNPGSAPDNLNNLCLFSPFTYNI